VPKLQGENRYHIQVGSYLLGIAAREVRLSGGYGAREAGEIGGLLGRDGSLEELRGALSTAIRSGALDDRWDEVTGLVLGQIIRKAAIVRPDHLAAADRALAD
jgi:hypothetical protein